MVNGQVVHAPLSKSLRKGQTVVDAIGVEGEIVGFKSTLTWAFRRPLRTSWVIVEHGGVRSFRSASELRVVERKAVA